MVVKNVTLAKTQSSIESGRNVGPSTILRRWYCPNQNSQALHLKFVSHLCIKSCISQGWISKLLAPQNTWNKLICNYYLVSQRPTYSIDNLSSLCSGQWVYNSVLHNTRLILDPVFISLLAGLFNFVIIPVSDMTRHDMCVDIGSESMLKPDTSYSCNQSSPKCILKNLDNLF